VDSYDIHTQKKTALQLLYRQLKDNSSKNSYEIVNNLLNINGSLRLYNSSIIQAFISNEKMLFNIDKISEDFICDLRFKDFKINSLEGFPKKIGKNCQLANLDFNRFRDLEEIGGDLSLIECNNLLGLVDAPKVLGDIRITKCINIPKLEKEFYIETKGNWKKDYYAELLDWIISNKKFDGSVYQIIWPKKYDKIIKDPNFIQNIEVTRKFNI
jgi:hypothetical protein